MPIAVLDGVELLSMASKPRVHQGCTVRTLWGELAWQLGGEEAYAHVKEADLTGTAPGKKELADMVAVCAPCMILMDELVRYVSQFEEDKTLSGGTYDTQLSFVQALTEALKAVPTAVLLASLPFSDREAGSQQGVKALRALEHYFGRVQACRRTARAIFLGSAPQSVNFASNQLVRGLELERVLLGVAQPGQQVNLYKDALRRLGDRLHHLNHANNRFWLDTRPNLRREMEERKRRFQDKEDVFPSVRDRVQRSFASGVFGGIHIFTGSGDVPDDWALRLVVLPPDAAFSKSGQSLAIDCATEILKKRGDQPRFKQNRLIFVAADYDGVSRLKDHVRSYLAWRSIVGDYKDNRIILDNLMAKQAQASLDHAEETVRRMSRETYKWLLAPVQEARPGKGLSDLVWEHFPLNPGAQNWSQEVERVLKENELLISEWAPTRLAKVLKDWFWKDDVKDVSALNVWQQSCQQLYLPRLKDDTVFQTTMAAGADSREFFDFAQGKEDRRYIGFTYGKRTSPIMDSSLLLIQPSTAVAYEEALRIAEEAPRGNALETGKVSGTSDSGGAGDNPSLIDDSRKACYETGTGASARNAEKRFYGSVDLDPILAKKQFADLVDEVIQQFTLRPEVTVKIAVEIRAESSTGFDEGLQRGLRRTATC